MVAICLGTAADLALMGHYGSLPQYLPFALCGLGVAAAGVGSSKPAKNGRRFIWGVIGVMTLGAIFGLWEHIEHNYLFEAEIRPNAVLTELIREAVQGASPVLAPGALALHGGQCTWDAAGGSCAATDKAGCAAVKH